MIVGIFFLTLFCLPEDELFDAILPEGFEFVVRFFELVIAADLLLLVFPSSCS